MLFILGTPFYLRAQIFKLQAGTSTLFGAQGGSVQFKSLNYDGQMGAGYLNDALRFGAAVHTKILDNKLTLGDETVRFDLPTDIFGSSHFFLARGVGVLHPAKPGRGNNVFVFLGATSEGYVTPFFTAASGGDRMAAVYLDRQLTPRLRFFSRNVVSRRQTSIQALEWTAQREVRLSAAAGVGSNQGYAASAVDVDRENFRLKAAYIAEGKAFERVRTPALLTSELEKENLSFAWRPSPALTISAAHQNILQPPYAEQALARAGLNEISATATLSRFSVGGGVYRNRIDAHSTLGTNLFVTRELTRRLSVTANLFHTRPDVGGSSQIYTGSTRFAFHPRLSLSGVVSRTDRQTSFGAGGEFTSNRLTLLINSQTVYVPLSLDRPFQQTVGVNASAYLIGDVRVTVASLVGADGRVRYTFGLSRFLYRQQGMGTAPSGPTFHFAKYVVVGIAVDDRGSTVEGAAVHVGDQVAYSDAAGHFMVRMDKRGPHAVRVAPEEFIIPGLWESVSAPSSVIADKEETAAHIRIVVRRSPAKPQS